MTISLQNRTNKYKTGKVLHADPSRYLSAGTSPRTSRRISKSNQCSEFAHPFKEIKTTFCCATPSYAALVPVNRGKAAPCPLTTNLALLPPVAVRYQRVRKRRKLMPVEVRE